jgi:hypothetical protein
MATVIDQMSFSLFGRPNYIGINFDNVDVNGDVTGTIEDAAGNSGRIHGSFDSGSNKIRFNDASFPGEILFTTFFTGDVFTSPADGLVVGMSGSWHEQSFTFARVGDKTTVVRTVSGGVNQSGPWLATNPQRLPS